MSITYRPALQADLAAAAELVRGQPLFEPYGLTPESLQRTLNTALEQAEQLIVAETSGQIKGLIWFQLRGTFGRSGYVRLLLTATGMQGQGIGARLLELAEQAVFAQATDMFLLVNADNAAARRFYERHGYRQVGAIPDYVATGLNELLLHRTRPS